LDAVLGTDLECFLMGKYERARADFEYLETLAGLDDQVELDSEREALMREPTKFKAAAMYESAIRLWFGEHRGEFSDERVDEIEARN
jgi:hypothetical protein